MSKLNVCIINSSTGEVDDAPLNNNNNDMVTGTVKDITKYYEVGDNIALELQIGTKLVTCVAKVLDKLHVIVPGRNGDVAYYYSDVLLTKGSDGYLYRVNIIRGTKTSYVIEIKESQNENKN